MIFPHVRTAKKHSFPLTKTLVLLWSLVISTGDMSQAVAATAAPCTRQQIIAQSADLLPALQQRLVTLYDEIEQLKQAGKILPDVHLRVERYPITTDQSRFDFLDVNSAFAEKNDFAQFTPNGETTLSGEIAYPVLLKLYTPPDADHLRQQRGLTDAEITTLQKQLKNDILKWSHALRDQGKWDQYVEKGFLSADVFDAFLNYFNTNRSKVFYPCRETYRLLWELAAQNAFYTRLTDDPQSKEVREGMVPTMMNYWAEGAVLLNQQGTITRITMADTWTPDIFNLLPQQVVNAVTGNDPHYSDLTSQCSTSVIESSYHWLNANQYEAENAELKRQLAELDSDIAELDSSIARKNEQLAELDSSIARKNEQLAELDSSIARKNEQLAEQKRQLAELDSDIAYNKKVGQYQEFCTNLVTSMASNLHQYSSSKDNMLLATLRTQIEQLNTTRFEITALKDELESGSRKNGNLNNIKCLNNLLLGLNELEDKFHEVTGQ
ncbi:hypothetical protein [uncultured Desulfuromonas sp.]|uniref:hypothetical protein n=1 Tax=uncultured Desulfuromonas sp. TaxID=181013 RepID=UPI002AAC260F|nr:hypothetical protein [uncultured Desulfuromonas sp.]